MYNSKGLTIAAFVLLIYMIAAIIWWGNLLSGKNAALKNAQLELAKLNHEQRANTTLFTESKEYLEIMGKYNRQQKMISGEGSAILSIFVFLVIAFGLFLRQMIRNAQQQRNFILSITHELKSPIASMQLSLQTLQKRKLDAEKTDKVIQSGVKEAYRLNELVNNLLLSAKLDSTYAPHFEDISLTSFLQDMTNKMRDKFPDVRFNLNTSEVPLIHADFTALTSLFQNLLENSVKYSKDQKEVSMSYTFKNERIVIEVADKGIGIPDREKRYVFQKFYRIGNEDTRKTKGTGLGLNIVWQVVKAHRGSIAILDNKPQGTIFRIWLPINPAPRRKWWQNIFLLPQSKRQKPIVAKM
jgi:signal transduction histidine kinase